MYRRIIALGSVQSLRFLIAGLTQLCLDWGLFVAFTALGMPTVIANPLARCCVVGFGFWLHGVYTFAEAGESKLGRRQLARFVPSWTLLTLLGTLALDVITRGFGLHVAWLAKPAVDAALAVLSFFVMRGWVFK